MSVGDALSAAAATLRDLRLCGLQTESYYTEIYFGLCAPVKWYRRKSQRKPGYIASLSCSRWRVKFEIYDPDCPAEDA
jgi:hypothetical protein